MPIFRICALSLLLSLTVVVGTELLGRMCGFVPSREDEMELWAQTRESLAQDSSPSYVIVGSSQSVSGIDPAVFAEEIQSNAKVYQLSMWQTDPVPIIADLANDQRFKGTIIVGTTIRYLAKEGSERTRVMKFLRYWRREFRTSWRVVERRLKRVISKFVFQLHKLHPLRVAKSLLWRRSLPEPFMWFIRDDRMRYITGLEKKETEESRTCPPAMIRGHRLRIENDTIDGSDFILQLGKLKAYQRAIAARGGRIIFVRMPSDSLLRELEAKSFPRSLYWDQLEKLGFSTIHFEDYPGLRYQTKDCSHALGDTVSGFTRVLARLIEPPATNIPSEIMRGR